MINDRLVQLKKEMAKGQQRMALLDQQRSDLRDTILRIGGAIQVLEELQALPVEPEHEEPMLQAIA